MGARRNVVSVVVAVVLAVASAGAAGRAGAAGDARLERIGDRHTWSGAAPVPANPVGYPEDLTDAQSGCPSDGAPTCDVEIVEVVDPGTPYSFAVTIDPDGPPEDDWDLYVYDDRGQLVGSSASPPTEDGGREVVEVFSPNGGAYSIRVQPYAVEPGATYAGIADLRSTTGTGRSYDLFDQDCFEARPKEVAPPVDLGQRVELDVLVLLDGLAQAEVAQHLADAARSYAAMGIDVAYTFRDVAFPADGTNAGRPTSEGQKLNDAARALLDGRRPPGVDIVYTLSAKDLWSLDTDGTSRSYGLLGVADCIGGVRYNDRAFATGEVTSDGGLRAGPLEVAPVRGHRTTAHEIGHLMGAHHHYFNCAEGVPSELDRGEVSPCTIMAPYVDLQSDGFGQLEVAVIRGHALAYATDGDAVGPDPVVPEAPGGTALLPLTALLAGAAVLVLRRRRRAGA